MMFNNDFNDSSFAMKVVFVMSIILISLDVLELITSFKSLKLGSEKFDIVIFENCIKYHIISQMVFTLFALFSGLSALMLSLLLILDSDYLRIKMYSSFVHWNYLVFGPYLLSTCVIGFVNFNEICYNCDPNNLSMRYLNISTVMSLAVVFIISSFISVIFAFGYAFNKIMLSIRFKPGGWKFLGRYFWSYVLSHENENNNNIIVNDQDIRASMRIEYREIRNNRQDPNINRLRNVIQERRNIDEENHRKRIIDEEVLKESGSSNLNEKPFFEQIELTEDHKTEE